MNTIIEDIKKRSEREKVALATLVAVMVTGMLFVTWGYNFAHSGKVSNLASGAVGVSTAIEDSNIKEKFGMVVDQFKKVTNLLPADELTDENIATSTEMNSKNVFVDTYNNNGSEIDNNEPTYGENTADVLY